MSSPNPPRSATAAIRERLEQLITVECDGRGYVVVWNCGPDSTIDLASSGYPREMEALAVELREEVAKLHADLLGRIDQLEGALRQVVALLYYPPNGELICRWCHQSNREHADYCSYIEQCEAIDKARAAARTTLAGSADSSPSETT